MKERKICKAPTVEEMKLRIKSRIWNIRKKKTFNKNSNRKEELKKKKHQG